MCVWNDCEFQAFPDCFSAKWSNAISRLIFCCLYNKTLLLKPVVVVASPIECSSLCSVTVDTSCCPPRFFCVLMLLSSFLAVPSRVLSIRKVELEFFVFIRCEQKHGKVNSRWSPSVAGAIIRRLKGRQRETKWIKMDPLTTCWTLKKLVTRS